MKLDKKTIMSMVKKAYLAAEKGNELKDRFAYCDITFSWNIKDIDIWFTIQIKNGKVSLKEGQIKDPDMIFCNETAKQFHQGNIEEITGRDMKDSGGFSWKGKYKYIRPISILCKCVREHYKKIALNM